MNATLPRPSRSLKFFAAAVKWSLWLLLAALLLLALAWGALHGWIVPRIGEFRPALEMQAAHALGIPVRIGAITARSEGLIPSFELHDVVLLDPQGREALRLPLVVASLSPRSVWHLGFEQVYIHAPRLDIRRAADGRIFVAGLDFSRGDNDDEGRAADWFFSQGEFVIEGGTIAWTDEQRGAPALALEQVNFVVRNGARRHALRLDATPPAEWGSRFTLAAQFRQPLLSTHAGKWQQWSGEMHADFSAVDLSQLRRHANLGFDIGQGSGQLRAWADVALGQVVGATADVALTGVSATLGPQLEPLALRSMSGRLAGKRLDGGFQLETHDLQFVTQEGQRWPGGNFALEWTGADSARLARGELRADRLDLGALSQIASRLPLGTTTHAALLAHAPQGLVERLQASWEGPIGAPQKYEAHGRATRLEVAAQARPDGKAGMPGVRGATLDFDLTQAGGKARLAIHAGALELPGVFEEPSLPFDSLSADLQWQVNGQDLSASVANLKFANADAQGDGQGSWRTTSGGGAARFPGTLDLHAGITRADGARVWRYLPLGVAQSTRDYVRAAVVSGVATGAKFRVKGELRKFPFLDPKDGQFLVTAQVRDVNFAFVPPQPQRPVQWPALTQLAGELVFEGNGMQVRDATGRLAGAPRLAVRASASIPDFKHPEVEVLGQFRGPLSEALGIVNNSPVNTLVNQALARTTGSGEAGVDLRLVLPVREMARSQVQGTVTLAGNDLQVTPESPALARARGTVLFSEKGFQVVGAQARALGGEVRLEGGTRPAMAGEPPSVQLRAQGTVTAEGLRQARELGFAARLARDFSGSTNYQLVLGIRRGQPEVLVTSNLQGMALNLPAPLGKAAETQLPLRYENALTRESLAQAVAGGAGRLQETIGLDLGRVGSVRYLRELGGAEPQVLRGAIVVGVAAGEAAVLPEEGVSANVQLASFEVDAWQQALARAFNTDGVAPAAVPPPPPEGVAAPPPAAMGYAPTVLALRARQFSAEGRTLHNVVVGGSREGGTWRANVTADELNGYVEYRQSQGTGAGRFHARLARLSIPAAAATQVEALLEQRLGNIPALDVVIENFELKGRKLGRLEIDAVNRGAGQVAREGGVREWRLNKLALSSPDATFTASGNWAALNAQAPAALKAAERRRTAMKFKLDIGDAGALLTRLGMKDIVRRGRGTMEGNVAWIGSPLALDYPTLTGGFAVNVEAGQFMKADPGLAKLLGVLSLQSLPRRLALDFRDVFSEGFAFDFVRGDLTIEQGMAATNNLQMKGVNAAVLMEGKADIARETQDLKVVVVPEINAGTASLVATVINPALGLGTFLAQLFLREPLTKAATQEFHVDGTWADPRVTRVGKSGAIPAQAAEAGPAVVPVPATR